MRTLAVSERPEYFLKQMREAQVELIVIQRALDAALVQELNPHHAPLGRATSLVALLAISGEVYRRAASRTSADVFLLNDLCIAELLAAVRTCLEEDFSLSN